MILRLTRAFNHEPCLINMDQVAFITQRSSSSEIVFATDMTTGIQVLEDIEDIERLLVIFTK